MSLSEHVYCVSFTFKATEQVEQWICFRLCIKLAHSSTETIRVIQKATAMGNWWLTALSRHAPVHVSHLLQSFLVKHQITQATQPLHSPDLAPHDFWLFPKLKSPLKGNRFQAVDEIQENTKGQLMAIGRTLWGPKELTLKGTEASLTYVQCFLYIVSSSINASTFPNTWLDTFWTDLI